MKYMKKMKSIKDIRIIGMKAVKEKEQLQKIVDSWKDSSKNLWRLINSGMSSSSKIGLGYEIKSNDEVLSYEEEMNFSVFKCSKEDSIGKPSYSRFTKTNDFKDTLSMLGKFDGKSDEGFLVGYSLNSKAYRVYNLVTKRVEVNLHVNFLEDKPNVKGVGYRWMFDIDYLTDSMNYIPVSLENQANPHASASEVTNSAGTPTSIASEE
ncbi:hypothetical protein Tco_0435725 [Tanacetum coccineum]